MPKPCQLKEFEGGLWARLDIDWDGGLVSLYTPIEISEMLKRERQDIIHAINNLDRIIYRDDD